MQYLVGVDVGTTSTKAVLVDEAWSVVAEATQEYATRIVGERGAEQDPDDWWTATAECVRGVLERSGAAPGEVAGIGVSSQAPSVVLVDAELRPLRPAVLWMDRRGQPECELRSDAFDEVLRRTGNRLDAYFAGPTLAWLLRSEPDLARRTGTVLMASGYVVARLTGAAVCDTGHAGLTLLADLGAEQWAPDLADLWEVPARWLPSLSEPSALAGAVLEEAAAATGLRAGTPVVVGGVDGVTSSLAAGVATHGDLCEMTGQSTVLNTAFDREMFQAARDGWDGTLSVLPYPVAGHHLVYGSMVATGGILRWFRDQFGDREVAAAAVNGDAFALLAASAAPGSGGLILLPYFLGERSPIWDPDARGAIVGLSMSTERADVVRAILEGTAYGLNHNLDEMRRIGLTPMAIRAVGGAAHGRTWNQIKADVTGVPLAVATQAATAPVGAALLAGAGVGLVDDLTAVVTSRVDVTERFWPDPERHRTYAHYYARFRQLYPALRHLSSVLES